MEEVSGADLGWFFRQWVYRAGSPSIEGSWKYDSARKRVEIELAQTQGGGAYRLPLEVAVGAEVRRIEMTEMRQRFEIPAERAPASVTLDPNTWMLVKAALRERR
jgi:aminopeptidase N